MNKIGYLWMIVVALLLAGCQKVDFGDEPGKGEKPDKTKPVTLTVAQFESIAFPSTTETRAALADVATHIDFAVFDATGTKVAKKNEKAGDDDYGTASFMLGEGTYAVVIIAHNGTGSATISSTEKASFPNNKMTDTFTYYGTLIVGADGAQQSVTLHRVVAAVRFILLDDKLPTNLDHIRFYYTGGSSTLNPSTGLGAKNSRQEELRTVAQAAKDADGHYYFDLYTIPKAADGNTLKLTVQGIDAVGNTIKEQVFSAVPVTVNTIMLYKGTFFTGSASAASAITLTADAEWGATNSYNY